MEPDVVRLYSSSPPPLDEGGEEEEEDEFGEFGGYCGGVSSSFSLSEFDTPTAFSQSLAAETSPPDLYITPVQSSSSSGKNTTSEAAQNRTEDHQTSLARSSKTSSAGTSVEGCDTREPSEIIMNGILPSDLQAFSTGQHNLACSSVPQENISTGQHRDSLSTDGGGYSDSNGHSRPNTGTEQEVPTSFNSTETDLESRTELSDSPSPLSANSISQEEVSEAVSAGAGEVLTESQDFSTSKAGQGKEKEVLSGLQGPSDEENFVTSTFCDPPLPRCGSEELGDCTEMSMELAAEVGEVSNAQQSKDSVEHKKTDLEVHLPVVEMEGHCKYISGTTEGPTVELLHDPDQEKVLREGSGRPGVPRIETDEDFGDFRDAVQAFADFSRTESATQEGFADFVTALSGCSTNDDFGDADSLKDLKEEEELPEEQQAEADDPNMEGAWCTELPPSDSFADFSSAPVGGLAESVGDSWVAFGLQEKHEDQQESWAAFDEGQQSSTATAPLSDDNVLAGLSCKLQPLFQSTFPSEVTHEGTEVKTLQTLLEPQEHRENGCHPVQREAAAMWRHLLDTHSAHGLKVQWVGSRSNRILLDCLGIHNILFTGQKKRPLIVPMFAAGLGMLEPTKDPVNPSPTSPAPLPHSSPNQRRSTLCTQVVSSLSSCEDGTSQRRASFSVTQDRALRHSRQKSYS